MKGKKKMRKRTETTKDTRDRVKKGAYYGIKDRDMEKIWKASKVQRKRFAAGQKQSGKHKKGTKYNSEVYKAKELTEYMRILNRQARRIEAAAALLEKAKKKGRRK